MGTPDAAGPAACFDLEPRGPFCLAAGRAFLEGFGPAGLTPDPAGHLHLAFIVDGGDEPAGVCLREASNGPRLEVYGGAEPAAVRRQVERILSLDVDGGGFPAVGARDLVVGGLQARFPGLRPVCFNSPYEAAAWTLLSQRVRLSQAARLRARLVAELGPPVAIHGRPAQAFPGPARLCALERYPGLPDRKVEWLAALGQATLNGVLDPVRLRALPTERALEQIELLPGVGPFSAELILLRGAGAPDLLPLHEPRVRRAAGLAYRLPEPPSDAHFAALAESWRPYRSWVCVLLRAMLEQVTAELGPAD